MRYTHPNSFNLPAQLQLRLASPCHSWMRFKVRSACTLPPCRLPHLPGETWAACRQGHSLC